MLYFCVQLKYETQYSVCKRKSEPEKVKTALQSKVESVFMEQFCEKWAVNLSVVLIKR
jgi:hypothetical protein